jgi:hypothetical protein
MACRDAILSYKPTDHFADIRLQHPFDSAADLTNSDVPGSPQEATEAPPTHVLGQFPSFAPPSEVQDTPDDAEFHRLLRRQASERQAMAYEFRREQNQILNNYYDAQLRENGQRNDSYDHRPLSDALRHISRRIGYPTRDERAYKYPFRCERLTKRFAKALEKLQRSQESKADMLYQKQCQDVQAYAGIRHVDLSEFRVPKLPTSQAPE